MTQTAVAKEAEALKRLIGLQNLLLKNEIERKWNYPANGIIHVI